MQRREHGAVIKSMGFLVKQIIFEPSLQCVHICEMEVIVIFTPWSFCEDQSVHTDKGLGIVPHILNKSRL